MNKNIKKNLQQKFINDLTAMTNGTATDGYNATGVHSMVHISPKTKRIVFRRFIKNGSDLDEYSRDNLNCFFTINTFRTQYRNKNNVVGLNGIWADCDVEKNGITKRFFYNFLPDILEEAQLFQPTYIVDSGHGFHLIFLFKHQIKVNHPVMLRLWDRLEENLLKRLQQGVISVCDVKASGIVDFRAKDCGRLIRTPGTNNLKHKKDTRPCRVIAYTGHYYDLDFLREELLDDYNPEKVERAKKYRDSKHNRHKISRPELRVSMNQYTLYAARLDDLYTLVDSRHYNLPRMRETILFMISVFGIRSGLNEDDVIQRIEEMNDNYQCPLEQKEIDNLEREIKSGSNDLTKYRYYNSTIINELNIKDEEQKKLKVLIDKEEKQNRQKQNRRIKSSNFGAKRKRNIRNNKIRKMYYKGINKTQIAKELNIGRRTVIRSLKNNK